MKPKMNQKIETAFTVVSKSKLADAKPASPAEPSRGAGDAEVRRVLVEVAQEAGVALEQPDEHRHEDRAEDVEREAGGLDAEEEPDAADREHDRRQHEHARPGDEEAPLGREPVAEREPSFAGSEARQRAAEGAEAV